MQDSIRRYLTRDDLAEAAYGRLAGSALAGLWVAGELSALAAPTVAVVGTRAPSEDGRRLAHRLARDLGAAGVCVISGLALGIDAAAHGGALAAGAPTIGVLGGGHDRFFPPRNAELARRIVAGGGAVLSPYPPEHPAYPWQFLARNGIVAALADGMVVVEAAARSGALNTASWAADRGIPVMAFPGDVERPKAAGCLTLIRDGATLVRDANDVLAQLGITVAAQPPGDAEAAAADPVDARILTLLGSGPANADAVIASIDLPPVLALARIGDLLAAGTIVSGPDGRFRRSSA
jgi:DNA processing protein